MTLSPKPERRADAMLLRHADELLSGPPPRPAAAATRHGRVGWLLVPVMFCSLMVIAFWTAVATAQSPVGSDANSASQNGGEESEDRTESGEPQPWDYDPYRVLIWTVSSSEQTDAEDLKEVLSERLDRDFAAIWRLTIEDAPAAIASAARRNLSALDFETIAASDPVIAVKRDHPDAVRIRFAPDIVEHVGRVYATSSRIDEVLRRGEAAGNPNLLGIDRKLVPVDGDALTVQSMWAKDDVEAVLVSRGMAATLTEPEAKMITPPVSGLVVRASESFDKIFIVDISDSVPTRVRAIEFDTLMRYFGEVIEGSAWGQSDLVATIADTITEAFAPVMRIDEAGTRSASGLIRAGGLILDEQSPGMIHEGNVLMPMVRKNDRNGRPIAIGPLDWAYLMVTERDGAKLKADLHAGRVGGLQGRRNSRTFRTALRIRPDDDATMLHLHAKDDPSKPLIGYEIYERELDSKSMTFVGRTNWNGRLRVQRTDDSPLRLMYVKNGGAVLARLPMVPGYKPVAVADLSGDDMRLQAEAYIRGVQNAIIDLVAIRELLSARVRLRLQKGEMEAAEELLNKLREQPTNQQLADDMGNKQRDFIEAIGRNPNQIRKVDEMFSVTREMLSKHINQKLIRDLETDFIAAQENGGKLPAAEEDGES